MRKDAHDAKEMQLKLSQQLFNCDDTKGSFDEDRKIGDGVCGKKMLKQKTRKKLEKSAETLGGSSETVEKSKLNSLCKAEEKITVRKTN